MKLRGLKRTRITKPKKLDKKSLTNGDFTICWEMFGNGVRTFMTKPFTEVIAFSVVVAGATKKGALWRQLEEEAIPSHLK